MASAPAAPGRFDRLSSTLFVAVLAHGVVILGVTFAPDPPAEPDELPSLNVTLLVDTAAVDSEAVDTELLAERDQAGSGDDDSMRPTRTLDAQHPLNQQGELLGADDLSAEAMEAGPAADQLISRNQSLRQVEAIPETTDESAPVPMTAAALLQQDSRETLAAELDDEVRLSASDDADIAAPSTRASALASYMVGWRQRVERVATANFPAELLNGATELGKPTVEVSIDADGAIANVALLRSSGDSRVDQAALQLLELSGPFEPLPEAILAEADVLRFAYDWDFSSGTR